MSWITVRLVKPAKQQVIAFEARLLRHERGEIVVEALWERPRLELGYVTFDTGDRFVEHYFTDRWYTVYAIHTPGGVLKGWYCNIARPAILEHATLTSEDLDLDLFVSPDRQTLLTLDQDEFDARGFERDDPATHRASLAALHELEQLARAGLRPFTTP